MKRSDSPLSFPTLILLLIAPGCVATPSERVETPYGVVCADDRLTAESTAVLLGELAPAIVETDASFKRRSVEIWVLDSVGTDYLYGGFDSSGRIHLEIVPEFRRSSLAHELVHAFEGPEWVPLPAVMQEGLADWVAARVAPDEGPALRANRAVSLASYVGGGLRVPVRQSRGRPVMMTLRVSSSETLAVEEVLRIPHNQIQQAAEGKFIQALYGLGLFLTSRIGIEDLLVLCRRARSEGRDIVPPEWIIEAAGLDPDPRTWEEAIRLFVAGEAEQRILRRMAGFGD